MIKSIFAAVAAAPLFAGAAVAGPYVNVEANSGWTGSDYNGTTTDLHIGYAGQASETVSYYVQGGPSLVSPDGAESETVFSGKAGASVAASEAVDVYGEVSFATGVDNADTGYGAKIGATWNF